MKKLGKDIEDTIIKKTRETVLHDKYDVECPHCGKSFKARSGRNTCPHCNNIVELTLNINF